jgi:1-acyl-sn-glycerol-3-phosphate acyltransferase
MVRGPQYIRLIPRYDAAMDPDTDVDEQLHSESDEPAPMAPMELMRERRFLPYFFTQFLGAFNDNVYKNALVGLLTFQAVSLGASNDSASQLINLSAGLFILPFFLLSATAGQVAEKYEKSMLIRRIKILEIVIMVIGCAAIILRELNLLFVVLFLMGVQSAFFGPIKYSILPQHLGQGELTGGNALVEAGTFIAILLGMIVGLILVNVPEIGDALVGGLVITLALIGFLSARSIPAADATAPDLKISFNFVSQTWRIIHHVRSNRTVFLSIMGISWFWFFGSFFLAQIPTYGRDYLGGGQSVVTLLMAMFTVGIALGSLICSRLSGRSVEIGLVPIGAFGITVFAFDLAFATPPRPAGGELLGALSVLGLPGAKRVLFDLGAIAVFGGLYIVPLYSLVQTRSEPGYLSRTIAAVNIINALFMVASAILAIALLSAGLDIPQMFLVVSLMNIAVAVFIFTLVPEFLMRLLVWLLMHSMYRLTRRGAENLPLEGPAVLVCNHVSYVDALIIGSASRPPVRFVMYHKIFDIPVLRFIFRTAQAIPIASRKEDPDLLTRAYDKVAEELSMGNIVCIFPEGRLTTDGQMNEFKAGIEQIIERSPVPVIPMALRGLWGSAFSRAGKRLSSRIRRGLFTRIELNVGEPVLPADVRREDLFERVAALRGDRA